MLLSFVLSPQLHYSQRRINRTPCPPIAGDTLSQGPEIQSRHHLAPQRKLRPPKLKYEALEITEVGGPLKEKCLYITVTLLGPLKARYLHITTAVGPPLKAK